MKINKTIGFLGFGNMGQAIAHGLVKKKAICPSSIVAYDPDTTRVDAARSAGYLTALSPSALALQTDILLLAVKPQVMEEALHSLAEAFSPASLVISIAAGVTTELIRGILGPDTRVIRVMPNTPAMVNAGTAGIAAGEGCTEEDIAVTRAIFDAVGVCEVVPETAMDVVTALSGSGPAYFFHLTECLVEAAVSQGLPREQAMRLAVHTLAGAGRLAVESGDDPAILRERVTSKGGTTAAALAAFAEGGFPKLVDNAVNAAALRSKELSR